MLDPGLTTRLDAATAEFRELETQLADPAVTGDTDLLRITSQRYRDLEPVVAAYAAYRSRTDDLAAARELHELADADERELTQLEIDQAEDDLGELHGRLRELLIPPDPMRAGR